MSAVPIQLPATAAGLVGREDELAQIGRRLTTPVSPGTVPTVMITGAPGTGKTALAAHAAQRLSPRYPDGQLVADLGGSTDRPAQVDSILSGFLLAIGVSAAQIPPEPAERSKLFHSCSVGRALLVCLDDAASAEQVTMLLPAFEGCAVIATSRFPCVPFGHQFPLAALTLGDGIELLVRAVGKDRVAADLAAAESIVRACDRLPLAVSAAGTRLAAEPSRPLWDLAGKLGDAAERLTELQVAGFDVRAACEANFRALGEHERAAVRTLSTAPEGRFTSGDAAAWLGCPVEEADALLGGLVAGHVLTVTLDDGSGPVSYAFHSLALAHALIR